MMREVRRSLFLITLLLVAVGIIMIYSASSIYAYSAMGDSLYFLKRHLLYLAVGFVMILGMGQRVKSILQVVLCLHTCLTAMSKLMLLGYVL